MAAARENNDAWQVGKSLTACLLHMLQNEVACDVTFDVVSSAGPHQVVSAHSVLLQARSPVFEEMFRDVFAEKGKPIVVQDVGYEAFKDMLKLVYNIVDIRFV